jgi:hypothetical protein
MRYAAPDRRVLEDWGGLPHLAHAGGATVFARSPRRSAPPSMASRHSRQSRFAGSGARRKRQSHLDLSTRGADNKATLFYEVAVP